MKLLAIQLVKQDSTGAAVRDNVPYIAAKALAYAEFAGALFRPDWMFLDQNTADYGGDAAVMSAAHATEADILLFTLFDWNLERSVWIAKHLRKRMPRTYFAAMGPAVLQHSMAFTAQVFDALIEGDAEMPLVDMLSDIASRTTLPKYSYHNKEYPLDIPDPYITGILPVSMHTSVFIECGRGFEKTPAFMPESDVRIFSRDSAARALRFVSERGAENAHILAPYCNERSDFKDFLKSLAAVNETGILLSAHISAFNIDEETCMLLRDSGTVLVSMELGSVHAAAIDSAAIKSDKDVFEQCASMLAASGIIVQPRLYLGLPYETYDTVVECFDFLGMIGMGQDARLSPVSVRPSSQLWEHSAHYGISDYLDRPPYWVTATQWMDEDDFIDSIADFEENFDVAWRDTVCPQFTAERGGFIACCDFRKPNELARLLTSQDRLASSVTLILNADDEASVKALCAAAPDIRKDNPYTLWQIVLCSDTAIPPQRYIERLSDAFAMPEHYFALSRLYMLDPQPDFQVRLFYATANEGLAHEALGLRQDIETIFIVEKAIPTAALLEANPFLALQRSGIAFELLYDIMSAYRDFPDLLLDTDGIRL